MYELKIENIHYTLLAKAISHESSSEVKEIPIKGKKGPQKNQQLIKYIEDYIEKTGFEILKVATNQGYLWGVVLIKR